MNHLITPFDCPGGGSPQEVIDEPSERSVASSRSSCRFATRTNELSGPPGTKVRSPAQVLLCKGCCCGRTDRGLPEVPVDRIKATWKAEKLNRVVQLTISGCLGPCDLPNVAVVVTARGHRLVRPARRRRPLRRPDRLGPRLPRRPAPPCRLPEALAAHRFERFAADAMAARGRSGDRRSGVSRPSVTAIIRRPGAC